MDVQWKLQVIPHETCSRFKQLTLTSSDCFCFSLSLSLSLSFLVSDCPLVSCFSFCVPPPPVSIHLAAGTPVVKASHGAWPPNWEAHYSPIQSLQEVRGRKKNGSSKLFLRTLRSLVPNGKTCHCCLFGTMTLSQLSSQAAPICGIAELQSFWPMSFFFNFFFFGKNIRGRAQEWIFPLSYLWEWISTSAAFFHVLVTAAAVLLRFRSLHISNRKRLERHKGRDSESKGNSTWDKCAAFIVCIHNWGKS